ncbi:sel1 repeat family protein [Streptomyces sp. SID13031]|uniref:sel1 repeat family protein n=1 Tax=Streptomyces sp. SID13031 TaxID=2706046 RepID=UPI0013C6A946|nr:sel1 repeat family protein [Streptomyces sp. SID13031]NEA37045.1 sel1 repeat family protein [Streptomyces sp. SID13031]
MALLLFLAAAGFSITGLITDNQTMVWVGWAFWAVALLATVLGWLRRRQKFGSIEEAQAAADAGDPRALRTLALLAKIDGDTDKAERLLLTAIDAGDVESMWEMGRLIEDRDGLAACEPWFRMAAENGHFFAKRLFRRGAALNLDGTTPL